MSASPALLVDLGHHFGLTAEHDLRVVLEVDLNCLVGKSEHDRMSCAHPLFHLHRLGALYPLWHPLGPVPALQLTLEVLEQRELLVKLLGVVFVEICYAFFVLVSRAAFEVFEGIAVGS